jgi:hypothetical protein
MIKLKFITNKKMKIKFIYILLIFLIE